MNTRSSADTVPARDTAARRVPARGFTLIEVLMATAIVGILAAIALPSYSRYMQQARRGDAIVLLSEAAGEQVRFFSENNRYATSMTELGYAASAAPTDNGHYTVSTASTGPAAATAPRNFKLSATPVPGGAQAGDSGCAPITISSTGVRGPEGCW